MTSNQIAYKQAQETERSNREKEKLEKEANAEKKRSNKANEKLTSRKINTDTVFKTVDLLNPFKLFSGKKNDKSWYNVDPGLVKDVASISFNTPLGNTFQNEVEEKTILPGICVLSWIPTIGSIAQSAENNVCNIAAKQVYSFVRHANSGSRNYESSDLMMYLLAVDQVYSYWSRLRLIYSLALTSKGHNRYYNDAMLRACGVDPDEIRSNLASFRTYINTFAIRSNVLYVPNSFSYYKRHMWLNGTIFKDFPVKKSQEYLFQQETYLVYDGVNGELTTNYKLKPNAQGTSVVVNTLRFYPNANITYKQITSFGDYILNNLISNEDIGIMSGDILKAYGEGEMMYLPETPADYHIESEYSEEVLSQIQGTHAVQYLNDTTSYALGRFAIRQDPQNGYIYQGIKLYRTKDDTNPAVGIPVGLGILSYNADDFSVSAFNGNITNRNDLYNRFTLNMYKDDVDPDDVMVATRNMCGVDLTNYIVNNTSGDSDYGYKAVRAEHYATELFGVNYYITLKDAFGDISVEPTAGLTGYAIESSDMVPGLNKLKNIVSTIAKFDWAPFCMLINPNFSANFTLVDNANSTTISKVDLDNMHYVAILSEFSIPMIGMKVRTR